MLRLGHLCNYIFPLVITQMSDSRDEEKKMPPLFMAMILMKTLTRLKTRMRMMRAMQISSRSLMWRVEVRRRRDHHRY